MRTSSEFRIRGGSRRSERGSVLVMTVVLLGALMVLAASFLRLGVNLSHEHNSSVDDSRAFYVAEAGVAEAGAAILSGKSGNVASQAAPAKFANGIVWVTATDLGGGDYQVDSTALCDSGRAAVRAVMHKSFTIDYTKAVTSNQALVVGSNFLLDSYDPALGSYASQPKKKIPPHNDLVVDTKGSVGSNGDIQLASGDRIYGDANPGPGGSISGLGGNTFVTGSTAPALRPVAFPPVQVPPLPSQGPKNVQKNDPLPQRTLTPGSYHFSNLTLGNGAAFTIQGPSTVVLDGLTTNSSCNLNIDATNGPVNVYFTGAASFVSNMTVTSSAPSAKSISLFFASSNPIVLNPNATLLGTIYAPAATVTVGSNWANFGAITANAVVISSNAKLHFDESLLTQGRQGAAIVAVREWQRIPVPASMTHSRVDPYKLLGLAPGSLLRSSDAYH